MLDIFAFLLSSVLMVLWFAGQNRTKQDHEAAEMATGVTINFKYTSTNIVHYPTTTTPVLPQDSIAVPAQIANWIRGQDYILLFLVPLNLIIFAFFGLLYVLRAASSAESVAQLGFVLTSLIYGALVCISLLALRSSKRNDESTLIVAVLTTLRALGALAPIVLSEGFELLISQTVLDTWGNFLSIHLLTVLAREYFAEKYTQPDLEKALSIDSEIVADPTTPDPAVRTILTRENLLISAVLACSLITTVLVVIPDWHNKPFVIAGFECSIWVSLILEFTITVFVILQIIPMVFGKSFGSIRTRWIVLAVIIGGITLRILFDFAANTNELAMRSYVPFVSTRAFLNFWKESFTQAIPLAFHLLLNIVGDNQTPRNAVLTMKQIFCAYLFALHVMAVGLLLESPSAPHFGQAATCVGALLALTDASLVLCKVVPRIAQRVQKDV